MIVDYRIFNRPLPRHLVIIVDFPSPNSRVVATDSDKLIGPGLWVLEQAARCGAKIPCAIENSLLRVVELGYPGLFQIRHDRWSQLFAQSDRRGVLVCGQTYTYPSRQA